MNIKSSINPIIKPYANNTASKPCMQQSNLLSRDTFSGSIQNFETKQVSFSGLFSIFSKKKAPPVVDTESENATQFAKSITQGINKDRGTSFPAKNFSCVVSADEFRGILPNLKQENFEYNEENFNSGVYCADLDNQTNYSGDKETVFSMMEKVSKFSNQYYKKTGKDFIFALTDKDSLDSVKTAMYLIGEEPKKYEHVKFVPGIKMSFAHRAPDSSSVGYENSEMLIYGINPFSENLNKFVDDLKDRRKSMVEDFIKSVKDLYPQFEYNINEFVEQNELVYDADFVTNLYWKAKAYAEKKGGDALTGNVSRPEQIFANAQSIFEQLDTVFLGSDLSGSVSSLVTDDSDEDYNHEIRKIFDKFSTHYDEKAKKEVSAAENIYIDLVDCLAKEEQKPVMAIASPYYFSHYYENSKFSNTTTYDNVIEFFNVLQAQSKGMLCAFESSVPIYGLDQILGEDTVKGFNEYLRNSDKCNLYEVGGSFHRVSVE